MEVGARVWLRSNNSRWGWVPAKITGKEDGREGNLSVHHLTITNDTAYETTIFSPQSTTSNVTSYFAEQKPFETVFTVDPEHLKTADHDDIKLRNLSRSFQLNGDDHTAIGFDSPTKNVDEDESATGVVDDLIGLTHLHEPAILHALRLRYCEDIIYTSTGPILIAINPFKSMNLYSIDIMEKYRIQGEREVAGQSNGSANSTPFKRRNNDAVMRSISRQGSGNNDRLPPHVYQTADDAFRAMLRNIENSGLVVRRERRDPKPALMPTNQSILVSGESGAGKTVTTNHVLKYLAMLSRTAPSSSSQVLRANAKDSQFDHVCIEQQVLQSTPILESFGNARTIRNDNSSRFGKYIDITFTPNGKLMGASIETYLLEKVRLIHPSDGERNYHIFYQFLSSATKTEREQFYLDDYQIQDFAILSQTGCFDRRDGMDDTSNHQNMLDAMINIGFPPQIIQSLMRLVVFVLFAGNITFTSYDDETCHLDENHESLAVASLLGVTYEDFESSVTTRDINTGREVIKKTLSANHARKACEALIKAIYGATFDFIVKKVNENIDETTNMNDNMLSNSLPSIGVLDIFGFESFASNNFEQICINYTNEALQQQFNRYVFKLEQLEYEKEGILWKYITFPDNQDVIDLIDKKHVGVLAILDEQCIIQSTDEKFTRYLYSKCGNHDRFSVSSSQRAVNKFSIEHYAGHVEYTTDTWLEKNKDQLPAKSAELLKHSSFKLLSTIRKYIRSEDKKSPGSFSSSITTKSVGSQFTTQLKSLRNRIDVTTPHYIRCLKPNDYLKPDNFEPKNIVEQLRCGGVLEAVRVSRAGYPTRYPHDVFIARYNILGDKKTKPMSLQDQENWACNKEEELKKIIDKIAFDMWKSNHQREVDLLEAQMMHQNKSTSAYTKSAPTFVMGSSVINGPKSLAMQTSLKTPEKKSKHIKKERHIPLALSIRERSEHSQGVDSPQSVEEYWELPFASRCAVAGLQLGRTKVFLRREAFDRIEAMRSHKFFGGVAKIQAMVRAKIYREHFKYMRAAAIQIQSISRVKASIKLARAMRLMQYAYREIAATRIQRTYKVKIQNIRRKQANRAAIRIQSIARGIQCRNQYYTMLFGIIRLQSIYRGRFTRSLDVCAGLKHGNDVVKEFDLLNVTSQSEHNNITPHKKSKEPRFYSPIPTSLQEVNSLYQNILDQNWEVVERICDDEPQLAEEVEPSTGELPLHAIVRDKNAWTLLIDMVLVLYPKGLIHKDNMGALPIHHAAAYNNVDALEILYSAYSKCINDVDSKGRLPLHVAAEFDAAESVKFLLAKSPESSFTMVHRPSSGEGGGYPLHVACRNFASMSVITALLAENFASAKRCDENGDLPLHLLLRCGEVVDQVVVKTLLTCFSAAASRTDMNGDLPLSIALKNKCKPSVVLSVLTQYPNGARVLNSSDETPLHLAFKNNADDRTILGLLNHAPKLSTAKDKRSGLIPIQVATAHRHSHFIVHNLLKRDMPIDVDEKVRAQLLTHQYSWNHIVCKTEDMYYQVVNKILQQCTQPQVLALAHVEGENGKIALASATPLCKHELRVMLRLFNTLEVVNQRPAYTNPFSDTQIFYALRYEPPKTKSSAFTILHEEKKDQAQGDYLEDWDDESIQSTTSKQSSFSVKSSNTQRTLEEKLHQIRNEKGQQVIAKLTSRSDVVERELNVRKDHNLSRHYVPAIISVHHTVQHAAYSEAMAEPGYCITMEGADSTAENLMLDMRKAGKQFPTKALKKIGISLLHMHEHGLVHGDFGTHNIGKFGSRWKLLGVGGSVAKGRATDPNRGFYHPPEAIVIASKRASIGKKSFSANVVSIQSSSKYDMWAYGVVLYEAIAGISLAPYACRGKRAMNTSEVAKIGQWDEKSLKTALKQIEVQNYNARDLLSRMLHFDSEKRFSSMKDVLEHPFFISKRSTSIGHKDVVSSSQHLTSRAKTKSRHSAPLVMTQRSNVPNKTIKHSFAESASFHDENLVNGMPPPRVSVDGSSSFRSIKENNSLFNSNDSQTLTTSAAIRKPRRFGAMKSRKR